MGIMVMSMINYAGNNHFIMYVIKYIGNNGHIHEKICWE